jgi:hypothetical protein
MNALLLYPDRPFGLGDLIGYAVNDDTGEREPFVISSPPDLDQSFVRCEAEMVFYPIAPATDSTS